MSKIAKIGRWQYFCKILKKKDIDEVYFLHADKPESFLQIDADILDVFDQT